MLLNTFTAGSGAAADQTPQLRYFRWRKLRRLIGGQTFRQFGERSPAPYIPIPGGKITRNELTFLMDALNRVDGEISGYYWQMLKAVTGKDENPDEDEI